MLKYFYRQVTFKPEDVRDVSLQGKTAIVTGSNSGVGLETSRQLFGLGLSKLILAVRNEEKGKAAAAALSALNPNGVIQVWNLDLSNYDSVIAFADRTKTLERLDIVILNAGVFQFNRVFNKLTGHDDTIQVNYLSTALLAILLLPIVKSKRMNQPGPSRITFTSSEASAVTRFKERNKTPLLAALDDPRKNDTVDQMFVSKLLGQFFLAELSKRVPSSVATINAASPGSIHDSAFNHEYDKTFAGAMTKRVMKYFVANTSAVGARMMTDAAVRHGDETHGKFLSFQQVVPMAPIIYTSEGRDISNRLWNETMTELEFADVEGILKEVCDE